MSTIIRNVVVIICAVSATALFGYATLRSCGDEVRRNANTRDYFKCEEMKLDKCEERFLK